MELIKQKGYYYLKHSVRDCAKVKTKIRYLGAGIPEDIEQIKRTFQEELRRPIYEKLGRIKRSFRKEWKRYPESVKKEMLVNLSVEMTYNTNAIEGSTITEHETEELIKRGISPNRSLRDVQETLRHSRVFFEALQEKKELSLPMLIRWHKELFFESKPDIAGKLRDYNVKVGSYRCPDWQDVAKMMADFFKWYSDHKEGMHPVELAAIAHFRFVKIHPFGDGNGRIARLLGNFILRKHKYPLLIIKHRARKAYYHALKLDGPEGEKKFVDYFIRAYLTAYKNYL